VWPLVNASSENLFLKIYRSTLCAIATGAGWVLS
jgi:hypothetical protein